MSLRPFCVLAAFVCFLVAATARAQNGPPPGSSGASLDQQPVTQAYRPATTPEATSAAATAGNSAKAAAPTGIDPSAAVKSVIAMFTPNEAVNVPGTSKPLPLSGKWGAQTRFPNGLPHACELARVPCVKVVYTVPEAKITCEWTLGYLVALEKQADGTMKHAMHELVLDENEAAAQYTLRTSWSAGDDPPNVLATERAAYPKIARDSNIGGTVTVRFTVGPDGLVHNASVLDGPPLLRESTLTAVRHWKFEPYTVGSQAVSFRLEKQFTYNAARPDMSAGMDPSGQVIMSIDDPRQGYGFRRNGASSGAWSTCSTGTGCAAAAPTAP